MPSTSMGSGHTKNAWSNFRPPRTKTCCWPFVWSLPCDFTRFYGQGAWTTLRYTLLEYRDIRYSINDHTFCSPPNSNETVGEPCSIRTETVGFSTAFPWVLEWRELPSFSRLTRFPGFVLPVCPPFRWAMGFIAGRAGTRQTPARISLSRRVPGSWSFNHVGHFLAKCPRPSHS